MENKIVAESFPPGEFIKDELEARGWTQGDLANIMGRQDSVVSAIINGKRSVSPEIASELASAFGTGAEVWMNIQAGYDLYSKKEQDDTVSRRAKLFALAPIKDMIRRGWIHASDDLDTLEREVTEFLNERTTAVSFHKSGASPPEMTPAQRAWLCRARKLARGVQAAKFSQVLFEHALDTLKRLLVNPEDIRHVARVLAEAGVRFLIVEALPHTKIDGACFWLDKFSPVIVLTMRLDRMDNFWYILSHECGHIRNEDGIDGGDILDLNMVGEGATPFEDKSDVEKRADTFAAEFLIDRPQIEHFIRRYRPLFSKQKIRGFAARIGVHPAIVLGQLQHRKEVDWSHSREMLAKVRDIAVSTTLTDGFGHIVPIGK
jgi:HTH-type transcriptional regulator/antitoxin HigA